MKKVMKLLKTYVIGRQLIPVVLCLCITSILTFLRPLIIKGITDQGFLRSVRAVYLRRDSLSSGRIDARRCHRVYRLLRVCDHADRFPAIHPVYVLRHSAFFEPVK